MHFLLRKRGGGGCLLRDACKQLCPIPWHITNGFTYIWPMSLWPTDPTINTINRDHLFIKTIFLPSLKVLGESVLELLVSVAQGVGNQNTNRHVQSNMPFRLQWAHKYLYRSRQSTGENSNMASQTPGTNKFVYCQIPCSKKFGCDRAIKFSLQNKLQVPIIICLF